MALVLEPHRDAVVVEVPQALSQRIIEFALPFARQKRHDLVPADDVLATVSPLRVGRVRLADALRVTGVPGVLGSLHLLDCGFEGERRGRRQGLGHALYFLAPGEAKNPQKFFPGVVFLLLLAPPDCTCPIVTDMDFAMSAKATDYHKRLSDFMTEYVFPAEAEYDKYRHEAGQGDH